MTAGLVVCLAALAVGTVAGLAWRAGNGRMRAPGRPRVSGMPGASERPGTGPRPASQAGAGQAGAGQAGAGQQAAPARITAAQLGGPLGERATLLQFSSAFCAPCRATRRILTEVAGMIPGVAHLELDAESRLDLVRELGVLRTPTVLVLAADGQIVRRASGQPRKADVIGAVGEAVGPGISYSAGLETGW